METQRTGRSVKAEVNVKGERKIWIDARAMGLLTAERRRGEDFSGAIIRLTAGERWSARRFGARAPPPKRGPPPGLSGPS